MRNNITRQIRWFVKKTRAKGPRFFFYYTTNLTRDVISHMSLTKAIILYLLINFLIPRLLQKRQTWGPIRMAINLHLTKYRIFIRRKICRRKRRIYRSVYKCIKASVLKVIHVYQIVVLAFNNISVHDVNHTVQRNLL